MAKSILMIVGSMRKQSFNRQLAKRIAELTGSRAEVSFLEYGDLPYMDQDIEFPAPEQVARVREQVMAADGVWIVTPEYNHSYPGVLKNLLDWLSRPLKPNDFQSGSAISDKKTAISGVGGKRATCGAREALDELLDFMKTERMKEPETGVAVGAEAFQTNILTLTPENEQELKKQVEAFLEFIGA